MFCGNCGNEIKEGVDFCSNCGTKIKKAQLPKEEKADKNPEENSIKGEIIDDVKDSIYDKAESIREWNEKETGEKIYDVMDWIFTIILVIIGIKYRNMIILAWNVSSNKLYFCLHAMTFLGFIGCFSGIIISIVQAVYYIVKVKIGRLIYTVLRLLEFIFMINPLSNAFLNVKSEVKVFIVVAILGVVDVAISTALKKSEEK
jgi:hypothetical protein